MSITPSPEPIEALPMLGSSVVPLPADPDPPLKQWDRRCRRLALRALRQAMADRQLDLPLGPSTDPEDPKRLLTLNGFAVQLVLTGSLSDEVVVPLAPWRAPSGRPQLLLAAGVDEEDAIVQFNGVMTGSELRAALGTAMEDPAITELPCDLDHCLGGVDRLFLLVQVLDLSALPRSAASQPAPMLVRVRDWLQGRLDPELAALGGEFIPPSPLAFRGNPVLSEGAHPVLAIPLALNERGLVAGGAAAGGVERFRLLLIPAGDPDLAVLLVRLVPELANDVLPEGLELQVRQGGHQQSLSSERGRPLELRCRGAQEPIEVRLQCQGGDALVLPPLQLDQAP